MAESSKKNRKPQIGRDFGTEIVIDSTASVEKILRDLLHRENHSKAYRFYRLLLVQRRLDLAEGRNYHYTLSGHPLKVFDKDWDGEIGPDYFELFPYKSTMPKFISPMRNIQSSDPVTDYLKIKNDWKHEVLILKQSGTKITKHVRRLNEDVMQVPRCLIELAALMQQDPDPNFNSTYNWYYAGNGNLQLVCINWVDYLLHSEFSVLYLTRLLKDNISIEEEHTTSFNCETDNILETICCSRNIVALRTKHKVIILKIVENDNNINFEKIKHFVSEMPFTSITFDKYHTNILYATTLNGEVKIVNIDRVKARTLKLDRKSTSNVDNWSSVIGGERSSYVHIEGGAVTYYDKRTNNAVATWTGVKQIVDEVHCNEISAAVRCEDSSSLYIATDHHVFLMDSRCIGSRPRALMRWTHGLRCAPAYITIGKGENDRDLIVVSSQWCQDTCVISNYANAAARAGSLPGVSLPYHAPDALELLAEARLKMLCFDIANPIVKRLVTAITGQVLYDQGENAILLTHNSLGDISQRILYPHYMDSFIEDNGVQALHDWSQAYKLDQPPREVSRVADIVNVWNKLRKVPDTFEFMPREVFPFDEDMVLESFTKSELMPELLDAWEEPDQQPEDEDESFALNLHFNDSI